MSRRKSKPSFNYLAGCALAALGQSSRMIARQRRIDLDNVKLAEMEKRRELAELKIAQAHDDLVLKDLLIEEQKLKLIKLQKELAAKGYIQGEHDFAPIMTDREEVQP